MEEATLTLFGLSGQVVSRQKVGGRQARLDLSHLPEGTYFVQLTDGTSSWREWVAVQ